MREADGLAASSRNSYLSPEERLLAPGIHAALQAASSQRTASKIVQSAVQRIKKIPSARIDYIEAVEADTLAPLLNRSREGRLAAAVFLGKTRLIDNIPLPALA